MKFSALIGTLFATGALASSCHPYYNCCNNCDVYYTDNEGKWGVQNNDWCFIDNNRCGGNNNSGYCKFESLGYRCCNGCDVVYTDSDGNWGVENGNWCGIRDNCNNNNNNNNNNYRTTTTTRRTTTTTRVSVPTSDNFFDNTLYSNFKFQAEVQSSINKLSGSLAEKAKKVKYVPTAAWLAWEGAPAEVPQYLDEAGSNTVVFVLYMIPTRDCNANASAGGSSNIEKYKGYVDKIYNTINQYPNSRIVMILEPDTIGNLVTANNDNCRNVQNMHKQALSYAISKFGTQSNVRVYLDAAHGAWLSSHADKTAQVIKEILNNAGNGKLRGISTNVSNYQTVNDEYNYHMRLNSALENLGVRGMKFIVDTSRNGANISGAFNASGTWCNFKGAGLGARPQGSPDPSKPLLDAYMWIKTPGEADGSSSGSRADPVCARYDSLQGAPDAGSWFHDYFVMLVQNANPAF
ncbi:cellulase A [Piromyces finnis]|uniref:Glucanase n=1 Tax=Piromyces finnis TaxID=1754191 RepID=A0A1Y1V856_9FUNG|nr:cellulase A [Piromyces finnis]|eukprot:ORX49021.1 cellulase A [Piromyces finnis]